MTWNTAAVSETLVAAPKTCKVTNCKYGVTYALQILQHQINVQNYNNNNYYY